MKHLTFLTIAIAAAISLPKVNAWGESKCEEPSLYVFITKANIKAFANAAQTMTDARIKMTKNGDCSVENLVPGGTFAQLGLRNKDIILETNLGPTKTVFNLLDVISKVETKKLKCLSVKDHSGSSHNIQVIYQ